jgi:hypothetical protein
MKVLASYPDGHASVAAMKADLAVLAGAGAAWTDRLKRLAARQPDLDIFGQGLVNRSDEGWQLTVAGRELLLTMEEPRFEGAPTALPPKLELIAVPDAPRSRVGRSSLVGLKRRRRRRSAKAQRLA